MHLRRRRTSHGGIAPLHLAVERYVHCPRGGLVPLPQCDACDLMQGTLWGDRVEVLCAYPEPVPALSSAHGREGIHGSQGAPASVTTGAGRDAALALAPQPAASGTPTPAAPGLIFEADWPED